MPLAHRTEFVKKTAIVRDMKNVAIELAWEANVDRSDAQWFLSSNIDTDIELSLMYFFLSVDD
jgi:hypothetical protein